MSNFTKRLDEAFGTVETGEHSLSKGEAIKILIDMVRGAKDQQDIKKLEQYIIDPSTAFSDDESYSYTIRLAIPAEIAKMEGMDLDHFNSLFVDDTYGGPGRPFSRTNVSVNDEEYNGKPHRIVEINSHGGLDI